MNKNIAIMSLLCIATAILPAQGVETKGEGEAVIICVKTAKIDGIYLKIKKKYLSSREKLINKLLDSAQKFNCLESLENTIAVLCGESGQETFEEIIKKSAKPCHANQE